MTAADDTSSQTPGLRATIVITGLLLAAAAHYTWTSYALPITVGYDTRGHLEYIATLVDQHRLPHPLEAWSTFHPPLYYLLGSVVSLPGRPAWNALALRSIGALAMLAAGLVSFRLVLRLRGSLAVASIASALVLFVPCSQFAATMVGNEALGAGLAALALPSLVTLQSNPRHLRAAGFAGLMAGLALATKFTGLFVAVACVVPFCRLDWDRRMLGSLLLCALVGASVAAPVYVRNLVLTGSPIPMTRELEPVKAVEDLFTLRERRVWDYLWFDPGCLLRPSAFQVAGSPTATNTLNPAMTNIWGLTYASVWYDAHKHRLSGRFHRDGVLWGPLLAGLGLVPTALVLAGFVLALRDFLRRRGRTPEAPFVVMASVALLSFIAFTWRVPTVAAVKASYMLPLVVLAAVFFARALAGLNARACRALLWSSAAAAMSSAVVFAPGLVFPLEEATPNSIPARVAIKGFPSGLEQIGQELQGAAPGRWMENVRAASAPDGHVRWRLEAYPLADMNPSAAAAWCMYVGERMGVHLPERPWVVLIWHRGKLAASCTEGLPLDDVPTGTS